MTRYFFGHVFVRFAKIIAATVLLAGFGGAAVRYVRGTTEAASVRYEPSAQAGAELFTLGREWQSMKQLMVHFLGQSAPPLSESSFSNAPSSPAEFAKLTAQLAKLQSERDLAKEAIVRRFEALVLEIEHKLRAHAAELSAAEAPPPQASTAKPPEPEAADAAAPKTLFEALPRAEVATRRNALSEGSEFIDLLKTSAENPDNAVILSGALDELAILERFLPATLESAAKSPPPKVTASEAPPAPKPNAAKVADQLAQVRSQVRAALLTDWAVDHLLAQTVAEVAGEQKRRQESTHALKELWLNVVTFMAASIVGSMLTSFLILVLADVVRATLDAAASSALVAAACQSPPPDEAEAVD